MAREFDLVIKGGRVLDGTGSPWFKKDIGIKDGKIEFIGALPGNTVRTIDAAGLTVSPGFIDLHSHTDHTILPHPNAESFIMQGITTCAVGNCGLSMAPVAPPNRTLLMNYLKPFLESGYDYGWGWRTDAEYFARVAENGTALNLAPLAGQGTIRIAVMGFSSASPTREQMDEMKRLLEQSMEWGAFGLSTGLVYPPGSYSSTEEITQLASVLKKYGGIYATHMRNEEDRLIDSVDETIRIGEASGVSVEISHMKAKGRANWGKVNAVLRIMEAARQRGVEVTGDVYPYLAGSTSIVAALPVWVQEGGTEKMLARLKEKEVRQKAQYEIESGTMIGSNGIKAAGWHGIFISACAPRKEYEGKSLEQILKLRNAYDNPFDGYFDLLLEIEGNAATVQFYMDEADVRTVISHPLVSFITDAGATSPGAGGKPHPRTYGTFPRVLARYVREEKILSLEEAVRKMTAMPAGKLDLKDRGLLKEGFAADIVIFNPSTIQDRATFDDPHQYPDGIEYVIINGKVVAEQGRVTGVKPGRILRRE